MLRGVCLVVMLALLPADRASIAAQEPALEYDVKAAFILNFVRYVTWPETRRAPPFRVCVLGANPFGDRLAAALAGEVWQGAAMDLHRMQGTRDAQTCHLLYVPAASTNRFIAARAQFSAGGTLVVGETRELLTKGGMIQLFVEANKVRFSVNQAAADAAGLQISSRLLRLAREVLTRPGTAR